MDALNGEVSVARSFGANRYPRDLGSKLVEWEGRKVQHGYCDKGWEGRRTHTRQRGLLPKLTDTQFSRTVLEFGSRRSLPGMVHGPQVGRANTGGGEGSSWHGTGKSLTPDERRNRWLPAPGERRQVETGPNNSKSPRYRGQHRESIL